MVGGQMSKGGTEAQMERGADLLSRRYSSDRMKRAVSRRSALHVGTAHSSKINKKKHVGLRVSGFGSWSSLSLKTIMKRGAGVGRTRRVTAQR